MKNFWLGKHMSQQDLVPCNEPGPLDKLNKQKPIPYCPDDDSCSKGVTTSSDLSWVEKFTFKDTGLGQSNLCDPMQTGQIINDQGLDQPNRTTIYRYSKAIRGCDEAMRNMFEDLVVIDKQMKAHAIPIIWATQEKAVTMLLQENVRKDNSLVVDRIKLPILAIYSSDFQYNQNRYVYHKALNYLRGLTPDGRPGHTIKENPQSPTVDTVFGHARGIPLDIGYTLYAWTLFEEDMNQILEQVVLKFSPIAYIKVRGVPWETIVKLDSIANNVDIEPGDNAQRVFKYEFKFTVETYIPQPLTRKRNVLKTKTTLVDALEEQDITQVLGRLEEIVKELEE